LQPTTRSLFNADVRVLDASGSLAEALAWKDGRLIAVGGRAEVARVAGPSSAAWDVGGRTVLPGFIDAHQHPSVAALYAGGVRLTPPAVTDISSLQELLAARAPALGPEEWVVGMDWDEARLSERRPPTRAELDDAVRDRPVFALHYTCHRAVANSRALELAEISRDTPDPSGGLISRGRGGLPDGLLIERGMSRVERLARAALCARDAEGFFTRLGRHFRALVEVGVTRVVDAAVPGDLGVLYREAQARGLITIPTVMMPVSTTGYLEAPWDVLDGPVTGDEEGSLSVGPLKLVVDGAPGCAMCLSWWQAAGTTLSAWAQAVRRGSLDPFRVGMSTGPRIGSKIRTGIRLYRPDELADLVRAAAERGFAIASHAEGNEAIETALFAYAGAGSALARRNVARLEHVIFASRDLVERIAQSGASVVAQPSFLSLSAFASAPTIPGLRTKPLRWLLDAGVTLAASSDFPVTGFDPLDGIRAAVHRRSARGAVREPDQSVTLDEALSLYTRNAAKVCACLDDCGTLELGKRADIVVLDRRLTSLSELDSARVSATIVAGELAFGQLSRDVKA